MEKNSENEKSRHISGVLRSCAAAAVSSSAAAKDRPSRFAGVAGPWVVPVSSRMVAVISRWVVGSLETTP